MKWKIPDFSSCVIFNMPIIDKLNLLYFFSFFGASRFFWDILYYFRQFVFIIRPLRDTRDGTFYLSKDWEFQSNHALQNFMY